MNSEMMQLCFRNERDTQGNLIPIYIEVNGEKFVVTWETLDETDVFNYRKPTIEELGSLNVLWEKFGGTINSKGYKVLDSHIGMVYGDAMTLKSVESICTHMMNLGFAVENVVFGAGSYSFQYNTRDTQGWAYKATYGEVDGKPIMIFKDPKTSDGQKTSQRGMVRVYRDENGEMKYIDGLYRGMVVTDDLKESDIDLLETVFINGSLIKDISLNEIRLRIHAETGGF